jgi:acyl-CoA thioester hydrolase
MEPFVFRTRIRFIDTDASGRIHYTALFRYFESAEIEFLRTVGLTYDPKGPISFPRVHVECDYKAFLGHDDEIAIEVRLGRIGRSSVHFEFTVFKADLEAAAGKVVVVSIDRESGRPIPLPAEIRDKLQQQAGAQ